MKQQTSFLNRFTSADTEALNALLKDRWTVVQGFEQSVAAAAYPATGVMAAGSVTHLKGAVLLILEKDLIIE